MIDQTPPHCRIIENRGFSRDVAGDRTLAKAWLLREMSGKADG